MRLAELEKGDCFVDGCLFVVHILVYTVDFHINLGGTVDDGEAGFDIGTRDEMHEAGMNLQSSVADFMTIIYVLARHLAELYNGITFSEFQILK